MKRSLPNWCALIVAIGCNIALAGTIVMAALPAPAMSQAHVAAAIAYEETPRPEGLLDDMQPLPGVGLRFLSISAIDGFRIAAALWQPLAKPAAATTLLVQVHGSGGNFAELPLRATARALSARGFAALSISTRQHDEHVNTDNFLRSGATSRPQSRPPRRSATAPLSCKATALGPRRWPSMRPPTGTRRSGASS
jgi:hypothetical protein